MRSAPGATLSGTTLTWAIPTLMPGASEPLSYTVTVNDDATNQTLHNVATPGRAATACRSSRSRSSPAQRAAARSSPRPPTIRRRARRRTSRRRGRSPKTSDPTSGSTVQPGSTISYTLTATNVADDATLTGATATDDLSRGARPRQLGQRAHRGDVERNDVDLADPRSGSRCLGDADLSGATGQRRLGRHAHERGDPGTAVSASTSCTTEHKTPPKPHRAEPAQHRRSRRWPWSVIGSRAAARRRRTDAVESASEGGLSTTLR